MAVLVEDSILLHSLCFCTFCSIELVSRISYFLEMLDVPHLSSIPFCGDLAS